MRTHMLVLPVIFGDVAGYRWATLGRYGKAMVSFVKSVTFDCDDALVVAASWAAAIGSNVDEESTRDRAWVEPAGSGGPNLWFRRVPEPKSATNRQHFALRATGDLKPEVERFRRLGRQRVSVRKGQAGGRITALPAPLDGRRTHGR